MPLEVINRVNVISKSQKIPTKLTYTNRYEREIKDTLDELDYESSDDDSSYIYSSDSDSDHSNSDSNYDDDNNIASDDESSSSSNDDDQDNINKNLIIN